MEWLWAAVAIAGAFFVGGLASRLVRRNLERRSGKLAELGPAGSSMVFSLCIVVGLLIALGFIRSESLAELRDDAISYFPRALSALIVVILGGVVGTLAATALRESIGRSLGRAGEQIPTAVKMLVTAFAAILAASQLGIDTTVINIVVAAAAFALALAFALVVGMGSRPVATEIACGRALRRLINTGDEVAVDDQSGTVLALHPTSVEVSIDGVNCLIPNSAFTGDDFTVVRPQS